MNTHHSDDDRIGVPTAGSPPPKQEPRDEDRADSDADLREGETEVGRPPQTPAEITVLSAKERELLRKMEEEDAQREFAEVEQALITNPNLFALPTWLSHSLVAFLVFGLGGLLGLLLFSQTLSILADLAAQPQAIQYLGYVALTILAAGVAYAIVRLLIFYFRLRRNQQVRMSGIRELSKRTKLRWLARAKTDEARQQMERYLREYPITRVKDRRQLTQVGMTEEVIAKLEQSREELLDPNRFATTDLWFDRFAETFQHQLDEVAEARVQYWAKRTGVVTAVAPNGLVDTASTLYFSFTMIGDLCRIYNLRAGGTGTGLLLAQVFFNAYLAGHGAEIEQFAEQSLENMFSPSGVLYEMTAAKIVAKVGSKAASGALNFFLLRRLGRFSLRLLQPVNQA